MLQRVSSGALAPSMERRGTSVPRSEHPFPGFAIAARALWPRKTAAHLAAGARVTERAAKFWLAGAREPSPEAFQAVFGKIMERRRS